MAQGSKARQGRQELEAAFARIEDETPDFISRGILWLRKPEARIVRLPLLLNLWVRFRKWWARKRRERHARREQAEQET